MLRESKKKMESCESPIKAREALKKLKKSTQPRSYRKHHLYVTNKQEKDHYSATRNLLPKNFVFVTFTYVDV